MHPCPWAKEFAKTIHCGLINRGLSKSQNVCDLCQTETAGVAPTKDNLPTVLVQLEEKVGSVSAQSMTAAIADRIRTDVVVRSSRSSVRSSKRSRRASRGPGPIRMIARFFKALVRHLWGGAVKVPLTVLQERMTECSVCEFWDASGNLGFGRCNHASCGCTRKKLEWATEICPIGKWGRWYPVLRRASFSVTSLYRRLTGRPSTPTT